jgi:rare lipoprotein A
MRCLQVLTFSVPLTIGWAVTATPVGLPAVEVMPIPAVRAVAPAAKPVIHEVIASWYGPGFAGRPTTSGETFDPRRLTAASVTVPLGSVVKVENPKNGRSVRVRINDCGPYVAGRNLDLSLRAAQKIGMVHQGVAHLRVTPIKIPRGANQDRCVE